MDVPEQAAAQTVAVPNPTKNSLRDRWLGFRNRLLMDPRFQRFAARFPFTRPITRQRTRELFDIAAGFVYSQVLHACVSLGVLDVLAAGPKTTAELGQHCELEPEPLTRLLKAAESLKLIQRRSDGRYDLGAHGAALLGNPGIAAMVRHHAMLYEDLADPVALLRDRDGSALSRYWAYAVTDQPAQLAADRVREYSDLMAQSQALVASDILDAYPMQRHQRLLDLAGGEGVFLTHAARRWSHLQVTLFDLPPVADLARQRFAASGFHDRAVAVGGDLFAAPDLAGFDLVSLVRVIHDHDDAEALSILKAARRALAPGGRLILAEPMAGTPGGEAMGDAYFGFYLWAMGSGRARRVAELQDLLERAGFSRSREVSTCRPLLVRVLVVDV